MNNSFKIYCTKITPRLTYACNIIFKVILQADYDLVDKKGEDIDINYSNEEIKGALQVLPNGLLEQEGIADHNIDNGEYEGVKTLFHTGKGTIPFDIFSAVFYMCSRYEEYLPFEADEHGRFKVEDSVAYRNGFHDIPVVELWTKLLADKIGSSLSSESYRFQLTIDVDDAFLYKKRSFIKTYGNVLLEFISGRWKKLSERLSVLLGANADPWFTFGYIGETEKNLSSPVRYFFLLSNKSQYDSSVRWKNKVLKKLIVELQQKNKVGIHPSYISNFDIKDLHDEFFAMSYIVKNKPQHSRQHYLKLSFPDTFNNLIKLGILEDYSLGWASQVGFRAGISRSFPFYDITAEKETHLMLVPFMVMERTLKDYLKLNTREAISRTKTIIDTVKDVGGQFTLLWHNDSLSNHGEWEGWRAAFEEIITYAEFKPEGKTED